MEFRLLGPLEVRDGNRSLPLGGAKQRAVLAVLLLDANTVVSRDRLVNELWGERPPETAVTSVQVYVSRLRKVLPPGTLVTQAPGYVLRADPEQVDVRRAEQALEAARSALAGGEPVMASRLLADALGLWRGQPLAELAYEPFAQAEVARLEELRLVLVEDRIQADLALGRHAQLVGELESLVRRYPLRERLRAHLMLALYRSGRQAESLEAYQDARRALVDELGIDPGAPLQELEKAILRQDPKLDLPEPAPTAAAPEEPPAEPVPERKVVTILFAAVVGSTELGSSEDPERVRATLDRFYDAVAEEIERRGGTVEKFIGDAVMAVFGAPAAQEDHAERALHTALAMQDRIAALFEDSLALRIGVNTGEIVLGEARKGGSFVTGDAVNVAARLEEAAAPGEILVGERSAALGRGAFELGKPRTIAAKGKQAPVIAKPVTGSLALTRPRGVRGLSGRFVGRENELQQLREVFDRATQNQEPHLVTVMADAGVGKTTLVRELAERVASTPSRPLQLTGRCLPYGRAITYRPLADIVRQQLEIFEGDPVETVAERLGSRRILGLALGLDTAGDLHPSIARDRLHEAAVDLLEEASAQQGSALVVVEDLHWAEEPLLDLIEQVVREARGPLCLIGTARLELLDRRPSWGGGHKNTSLVWLEPMSPEESEEMLAGLLERDIPPSLRDLVHERAEGNPFFLEELLAVLIDRGALRLQDGGGWDFSEVPADLAVPDSIHALVAARIDLLRPDDKAALQAASVIGRTSWAGAIRELVGDGDPDLATLEERDFIRRRPDSAMPGEREYVFKHALTREVAYGSIAKARRATLHAGFAEWIELRGLARDEDASLLAHHYAEAVRPEHVDLAWHGREQRADELRKRAVTWLRRAAELAVGRFELDEALALIDQALELAEAPTQVELLRLAADAHRMRFEMGGFREALEQALAHDPPKVVAAEIYAELAGRGVAPYMWKQAPSSEDVERWTRRALDLAERESHARAVGLVAKARHDPGSGREAADEAVLMAERFGDPVLRLWAYFAERRIASLGHDYEALERWTDRTVEVLPAEPDPSERANEQFVAAIDYLKLGQLAKAHALVDEHAATAVKLSAHHRVHVVSAFVLEDTVVGRWTEAFGSAHEVAEAAAANLDTPCQFNWRSLAMCALAAAQLGDDGAAGRLEERARELAAGAPEAHEPAFIRLALLRGDLEAVEELVAAAPPEGSVFDVDTPAARLDALVALGDRERVEQEAGRWVEVPGYTRPFALRALGVVRGDRSLVDRAAAAFDELGLGWRAEETRALTPRSAAGSPG